MRHLEETDLTFIPEEIAIQEAEILHLAAAITDPHEALKIAYGAGAVAMEKLDELLQEKANESLEKDLEDISIHLMLNKELLVSAFSTCFEYADFNGDITTCKGNTIEEKMNGAADWAFQFFGLVKSVINLVAENLDRLKDELLEYT